MSLLHKAFGMCALAVVATACPGIAAAQPGSDGRFYGSMASEILGDQVHIIWALNYPSWADSDGQVLSKCVSENCTVQARFANGCGSIAIRNGVLLGGSGFTRGDAEGAAMAAFGPPDLVSMSAGGDPFPTVLHTECTAHSG
ncbi:DUF4189 domain-containing protein [Nocardia otitidiscaviarum]|uniref:DUF4189 domain-containing protein n=1 Tax=Nocardia otitidiscaviarum TaxID=1823 RepID=UPI001895AFB1|nr:DUF4189 domain-containing protein [Nocardia otitidiscaviarum]MBF6235912.1 DUF4189 domain-containing protein [Nocardia otitidiscaviarum]